MVDFKKIEGCAAGKLACVCGNQDWQRFLYVGVGDTLRAGCKTCARAYVYVDGQWRPA